MQNNDVSDIWTESASAMAVLCMNVPVEQVPCRVQVGP